ncbi:unnamed protein product [Alopecurus aequalis]
MARTPEEIVSDLARDVLGPAPWSTLSLDRPIVRLPRPAASHAAWRGLPETHLAKVFRHLPVPDLVRLGYLFTPRWREVWRLYPLYLHDRQLASLPIPSSEVANAITNVLEEYVGGEDVDPGLGPVHTFRVESTEWGLNHADRWCGALRKGKVVEVVLFNRGSSDQLVHLPPRLLECTNVQILHLAFFTLEVGELAVFTDTNDLGLHGCACPNGVIERVVKSCRFLKRLWVHDGAAMGSIVVKAARCLVSLSMLRTVSRSLTVDNVPLLVELIPGSAGALSIGGAPELSGLVRLNLPDTTLKITDITLGSEALEPQMPSVRKLWLVLDYTTLRRMGEHMVPRVVQQMLMRFPHLDRLIIERKDDVPQEEGMASRDDAHTHGHLHLYHGLQVVTWRLHTLTLFDFRAGKAELELLKALMDRTHKLRTVELVYRDGRHGIGDAIAEVHFGLHQFVLRSNNQSLSKFKLCLRFV